LGATGGGRIFTGGRPLPSFESPLNATPVLILFSNVGDEMPLYRSAAGALALNSCSYSSSSSSSSFIDRTQQYSNAAYVDRIVQTICYEGHRG